MKSDTITACEVNFSVLATGAAYDVAALLTMQKCSLPSQVACTRGVAFDRMQFRGYDDLGQVARQIAESVYSELGYLVSLDSLARPKASAADRHGDTARTGRLCCVDAPSLERPMRELGAWVRKEG